MKTPRKLQGVLVAEVGQQRARSPLCWDPVPQRPRLEVTRESPSSWLRLKPRVMDLIVKWVFIPARQQLNLLPVSPFHSMTSIKDSVDSSDPGLSSRSPFVEPDPQNLKPLQTVLQDILTTLRNSSIVNRDAGDSARVRFWKTYRSEADEYDKEFLEKFNGAMDNSMVFSGLFCGACATFVGIIQPDLKPDPGEASQAIVHALALSLNGAPPQDIIPSLPIWTGPSATTVWALSLLYASTAFTLFAALGALLGKQWLNHYSRPGVRGTIEGRGKARQGKLGGLQAWHFHAVMESLPFLLQISLFLFGIGISAYLYDQQRILGIISIVANATGTLLYIFSTVSSSFISDCPFQTPLSRMFRQAAKGSHRSAYRMWVKTRHPLTRLYLTVSSRRILDVSSQLVSRVWRSFSDLASDLVHFRWVRRRHAVPRDTEASEPGSQRVEASLNKPHISRTLSSMLVVTQLIAPSTVTPSTGKRPSSQPYDLFDATSISWILDTSDDPQVEEVALEYALNIDWPNDFDARPLLDRLLEDFFLCFEEDTLSPSSGLKVVASSHQRALAYGKVLLFLYWHGSSRYGLAPGNPEGWAPRRSISAVANDAQKALLSHFGTHDELGYVCWLVAETFLSHSKSEMNVGKYFPAREVPRQPSASTSVALSRVLRHMLQDPRSSVNHALARHVFSLSARVPTTPFILESYQPTFEEAIFRLRRDRFMTDQDFNDSDILSRVAFLQEELPALATSDDFAESPLGRYTSGLFYLIAYGAQVNSEFRGSLRSRGVARWCLEMCQLVHRGGRHPASFDLWSALALRVAITLTYTTTGESSISKALMSSSSPLEQVAPKDRDVFTPHFPWIIQCTDTLWNSYDRDVPYPPVCGLGSGDLKLDLVTCGLLVAADMFKGSPEGRRALVGTITGSLPSLKSDSEGAYHAILRCTRSLVRSPQNDLLDSFNWFGSLWEVLLHSNLTEKNMVRDEVYLDIVEIMAGALHDGLEFHLPTRNPSTFRLQPQWLTLFNSIHKSCGSDICPLTHTLSSLARVLLRMRGVLSLVQNDVADSPNEPQADDQRAALAMACAACSPAVSPLGEQSSTTARRAIKISSGAARHIHNILGRIPEGIVREMECCVRAASRVKVEVFAVYSEGIDIQVDFAAKVGLLDGVAQVHDQGPSTTQ